MTDEEIERLTVLSRSRTEAASRVSRAQMLLAYRENPSFCAVGQRVGVHHQTVQRCVERALAYGPLAAIEDRPRPVSLACDKAKEHGYPHELWTTWLLARHAEIEGRQWKHRLDGPQAVLTFAQAALLYRSADKPTRFLDRIEDYWKDTLVKNITRGAIRQSALTLYPNAAAATRNRHVIVPTQAIINHAAESELCPRIRVQRFKVDTKIKKPATLAWISAFMAHSAAHLGGLALFMFLTSARISEALAVRWDDIDFEAETVLIRQSKIGDERVAHLPRPLILALGNIKRMKGRPVFLYRHRNDCLMVWRRACIRAGIPYLSFHCCRHGFATSLLHLGIDVVTVAKRGGWKTPRHVLETYGHAQDDLRITDVLLTQDETEHARKPLKTGTS